MSEAEEKDQAREQFVWGLKGLLEFYENHPNFPLPTFNLGCNVYQYGAEKEEIGELARRLGKTEKIFGSDFMLCRKFSENVSIKVIASREKICKKIVKGKKIIPSHYQPEREEEIVEWECDESLLENQP